MHIVGNNDNRNNRKIPDTAYLVLQINQPAECRGKDTAPLCTGTDHARMRIHRYYPADDCTTIGSSIH